MNNLTLYKIVTIFLFINVMWLVLAVEEQRLRTDWLLDAHWRLSNSHVDKDIDGLA